MKQLKMIRVLFLVLTSMNVTGQELKEFDTKAYAITYPGTWTLDTSGQMNTSFLIFSKLEENDTFRENINLTIQDLTGMNLDLKGYTALSENQIKSVKDSEIFESKELTKNNTPYHQIVWKGFVAGKNLKFKQLYYIKDNQAFLVTFTCEQATYDDYVEAGTAILNSFILK